MEGASFFKPAGMKFKGLYFERREGWVGGDGSGDGGGDEDVDAVA